MTLVTVEEQKPQNGKWYLVRCPEYSESGYEVAKYEDDGWYNQNSNIMTIWVKWYNPEVLDV